MSPASHCDQVKGDDHDRKERIEEIISTPKKQKLSKKESFADGESHLEDIVSPNAAAEADKYGVFSLEKSC